MNTINKNTRPRLLAYGLCYYRFTVKPTPTLCSSFYIHVWWQEEAKSVEVKSTWDDHRGIKMEDRAHFLVTEFAYYLWDCMYILSLSDPEREIKSYNEALPSFNSLFTSESGLSCKISYLFPHNPRLFLVPGLEHLKPAKWVSNKSTMRLSLMLHPSKCVGIVNSIFTSL